MRTLARSIYLESRPGLLRALPHAGSALEHPLVYDDAAREFRQLADEGLVEIVHTHECASSFGPLIDDVSFRRLR